GRSRPGGTLRGVRRQRRDRRRDPDFYRGHRVRDIGVQRDGCAGRPLRRGQRARQSESHRLPGIPRRGGSVGIAAGPAGGAPAVGTTVAGMVVSGIAGYLLLSGRLPVTWHRGMSWRPDWRIIRELFRFGLPTGVQGIAMNIAGVLLLRFIGSLAQSAQAQAAYA